MFHFARWFTGVTLILIHLKGFFPPTESQECRPKLIGSDSLYVDCSNRNLSSIPQDLGDNLEILNISKNPFLTQLNDNDLQNYVELHELTMRELRISKISSSFFSPTQELHTLDISSTCFSEPIPELPKPMKRIVVNSMYKPCSMVSLPPMSQLEFLAEFESKENNLVSFPPLPLQAPIWFIDLSKNPMINLTYLDIAPFCVLSQLNLFGTDLGLEKHHNSCCGLKKWGERFKLSVFVECDKANCEEVDFDLKAVDAYNECVKTPGSTFFSFDYHVLNIIIGVAVLLTIGYLAFRYFKSDAMKKYREEERLRAMQSEHEGEHEHEPADEFGEEEHYS